MTALDETTASVDAPSTGSGESSSSETGGEPTFQELASRVDELRDRVRHTDEHARELLDDTLSAITAFNRAGLVELVQVLRGDARGEELLFSAVDRPEVMALLVAHDIVRVDRTMEVLRSVDQLRPYLAASNVALDVVRVEGDTAFVSFGTGCSAPTAALKAEVMDALNARLSGVTAVEEQVAAGGAFVPLTSLRVGPPA
jgi:Fe-S cluster biogenesis protein NfuA